MKQYVIGYAFNEECDMFVAVIKNKPKTMKGKINGVGGKLEVVYDGSELDKPIYETPLAAMQREFTEEVGYDGKQIDWTLAFEIDSDMDFHTPEPFKMYIFYAKDQKVFDFVCSSEYETPDPDEPVTFGMMDWLPAEQYCNYMDNVRWQTEFFRYILTNSKDIPDLPIKIGYTRNV